MPTKRRQSKGRPRGESTRLRRQRQKALDERNAELDEAFTHLGADRISDKSPQARYHYTISDQLDGLVEIRGSDPWLAYTNRVLVVCALPRRDPGDKYHYHRKAGKAALSITSMQHGVALPYGIYPRLIMAWITTEAFRKKSPVLRLGRSLSEFMDEVGVKSSDSGGRWGIRIRFTEQLRRLLACGIDLSWTDEGELGATVVIVKDRMLWWDPRKPKQGTLFDSYIKLSGDFYEEIVNNPVPFDLKVLRAMKRSTLGIDLYLWIAYRSATIRSPRKIPWVRLYEQFGPQRSGPPTEGAVQSFRKKALAELTKLRVAWPELGYELVRGSLVVYPSESRIPEPPNRLERAEEPRKHWSPPA